MYFSMLRDASDISKFVHLYFARHLTNLTMCFFSAPGTIFLKLDKYSPDYLTQNIICRISERNAVTF